MAAHGRLTNEVDQRQDPRAHGRPPIAFRAAGCVRTQQAHAFEGRGVVNTVGLVVMRGWRRSSVLFDSASARIERLDADPRPAPSMPSRSRSAATR